MIEYPAAIIDILIADKNVNSVRNIALLFS